MRYFCWCLIVALTAGGSVCRPAHQQSPDGPPLAAKGWELKPPVPDAEPVAARSRLPGIYPVGSRLPDPKALGMFGPCDNYPHDLRDRGWGKKKAISLVAFPDEPVAYFKHKGMAVRLINRTGQVVSFEACDSCLFLVREALDGTGRWREIESPPEAICGNSYHRVFLKPDQFWQFPARLYKGPIKTKIRFRLDAGREPDEGTPLYSNEFDGSVAVVQFRTGPDRAAVARALKSSEATAAVIRVLAEALKDEDLRTREPAATKLADFGPAAREAVPSLLAAMKGRDATLRATAAYALWRVDSQRKEAIRTLIAVLGKQDATEARQAAAWWLRQIGPAAREAVPALCAALADGDDRLRSAAAETLGTLRCRADVTVPALARSLKDPAWLVRCDTARALSRFGSEAEKAILPLSGALKDKDGLVRVAAALALWKIEGKTNRVVPVLIQTLKAEDAASYAPAAAAEALGEIGPPARAAVPALSAALKHNSRGLRIAAAGALWKITRKAQPAVAVFIRALQDRDSLEDPDTGRVLDVLGAMGLQAREAVPALLAVRKQGGSYFQERVATILKKIDPAKMRLLPKSGASLPRRSPPRSNDRIE